MKRVWLFLLFPLRRTSLDVWKYVTLTLNGIVSMLQLLQHAVIVCRCIVSSLESAMDPGEEDSAPLMIRDREGSQRSSSSAAPSLQVYLYFFPATKEATTIQLSSGQISAEDVCRQAANKCGKSWTEWHKHVNTSHLTEGWWDQP